MGVLVNDSIGKKLHSLARAKAMPTLVQEANSTMCGGISGRGTDFASQLVRFHTQLLVSTKTNGANLFMDARAAFDSLVREVLFGDYSPQQDLEARLRCMGFPESALASIAARARTSPVLPGTNMDPQLRQILEECHKGKLGGNCRPPHQGPSWQRQLAKGPLG